MDDKFTIESFMSALLANDWALIRKFSYLRQLSHGEVDALIKLHKQTRIIAAHKIFLRQGNEQKQSYIVTKGWGYRYNCLMNGDQQIINYYLPGDIISLFSSIEQRVNYSVASITPLHVCPFSPDDLTELFAIAPELKSLLEYMLVWENIMLAEQICRINRHSAYQRTAHFLLELFLRLKIVGHTETNTFISPLTQQAMADTLGLSIVHMNRTLKKLIQDKLIDTIKQKISLLDINQLVQIAEYPGTYQELNGQVSLSNDHYIEGKYDIHPKNQQHNFNQ